MSKFRYAKTEWGIKVAVYAQRHGMTLKELARRAGVNYNTFNTVRVGKSPGEIAGVIEKVEKYMRENQKVPESVQMPQPFN